MQDYRYYSTKSKSNNRPNWRRSHLTGTLAIVIISAVVLLLFLESKQSSASIHNQTAVHPNPVVLPTPTIAAATSEPEPATASTPESPPSIAPTSTPTATKSVKHLAYNLTLPDLIENPSNSAESTIRQQPLLERTWQQFNVRKGDSLAAIFAKAGIKSKELHTLMRSDGEIKTLNRIHPGDELWLDVSPEGQLRALRFVPDIMTELQVTRQFSSTAELPIFDIKLIEQPIEIQTVHAEGVIEDSLFRAASKAGLSDRIIIELANLFTWDIDFVLEVRKGDRFSVIYEQHYQAGEKVRDGAIIAAQFVNRGETYRVLRYQYPDGQIEYYTANGESVRKAFMRNPVDFTRISSGFNLNRKHPVLNRIRAHKGVDYAAPTGTPIKAAGDGRVTFRGRKGGYGNTIEIQHGQRYSTLYAHMSKFNSKIKEGSKVKQGEIIGYVGSSGLATGPHLHYEFRIDGVHRNPLTVTYPSSDPLPKQYREDFHQQIDTFIAQLDTLDRLYLAEQQAANTQKLIAQNNGNKKSEN